VTLRKLHARTHVRTLRFFACMFRVRGMKTDKNIMQVCRLILTLGYMRNFAVTPRAHIQSPSKKTITFSASNTYTALAPLSMPPPPTLSAAAQLSGALHLPWLCSLCACAWCNCARTTANVLPHKIVKEPRCERCVFSFGLIARETRSRNEKMKDHS